MAGPGVARATAALPSVVRQLQEPVEVSFCSLMVSTGGPERGD